MIFESQYSVFDDNFFIDDFDISIFRFIYIVLLNLFTR